MRILAIDTSTKILSLGISDGAKVYEYNLEVGVKLSALLAPVLKRTLDYLGWKFSQIDVFAVGIGPGSFTGVRLGLAAIKGLAWSLNKPVVGISSLDILAANLKLENGYIIPVIDAKRNLVYCGLYQVKAGKLKRLLPYMLLTPEALISKIKRKISTRSIRNSVILGDGLGLHQEKLANALKGARTLDKDYWDPCGRVVLELARQKIKAKQLSTAFKIKPVYLYPQECQIRKTGV